MIIKRASFKNLHGHIDRDLVFERDVNVLIGGNGSGKTTILNAMAWTLSPESIQGGVQAAFLLSNLEFNEISIAFTLPGTRKYQRVTALNTGDAIRISARDVEGELRIPIIHDDDPPRLIHHRGGEEAGELIASALNEQRASPVLRYLSRLPGPLYLPLDRRWPETEESRYQRPRNRRIISVGHLPINDVLVYADRAHRREQIATDRLNYELRNRLLASLFEEPDMSPLHRNLRVLPVQEIENQRQRIVSTLDRLGLPDAEKETEGFFNTLEETVRELEGHDLDSIGPEDPLYMTWVNWVIHGSPLAARVERLVPLIEEYEKKSLFATKSSRSFLESLNGFLHDSGKKLIFSEPDILTVELPNGRNTGAANLSSGELQLLTLFTFLYFRFGQEEEFTIIIDEPELSLHLLWQSRYLEAITDANPRAQFIVATHSPEIAAPFEERIIDISPR